MDHNLFKSKKEYMKWAENIKVTKMNGRKNEDTDYELADSLVSCPPDRYPVIAVSMFEDGWDRSGDSRVRLIEFVYLVEFTENYDPYAWEHLQEKLQEEEHVYWCLMEEIKELTEDGHVEHLEESVKFADDMKKMLNTSDRSDQWKSIMNRVNL